MRNGGDPTCALSLQLVKAAAQRCGILLAASQIANEVVVEYL
jgi:hypothetical protein